MPSHNGASARSRKNRRRDHTNTEKPTDTDYRWQCFRLSRLIFVIFHPAVIAVAIMIFLLACKIHQLTMVGLGHKSAVSASRPSAASEPSYDNHSRIHWVEEFAPSTTIAHTYPKKGNVSRKKRSTLSNDVMEVVFRQKMRAVPLTSLDDMLLDAETALPDEQCLPADVLQRMQDDDNAHREDRQGRDGKGLSEHGDNCTSSVDCLTLSPYVWSMEGTGEPCRKKTFLRCNITANECQCQDKFDLRWDTVTNQSTYQWNPVTKTCYVRPTNPCKQEIPCAPGTTCRTTVSISFNTPPIQRICECTNIKLIAYAGNAEWWYCKSYWQRTWLYDLDNVNKWPHQPYHIYYRLKDQESNNMTEKESSVMEVSQNDTAEEEGINFASYT